MEVEESRLGDDEPVRMTAQERTVWAYLTTVVLTSGGYFAVTVSRLLSRPVAEIPWAGPMLWAIGLSVAGSIALTIVFTIVADIRSRSGCSAAGRGEVDSDVRDREIGQHGGRAAMGVISAGFVGALILAMLDAHTFWIGNLLFLSGTVSAVAETGTRIYLYRRGF